MSYVYKRGKFDFNKLVAYKIGKGIEKMIWNPWHGCHKISPGCLNCYMFRRDAKYNLDSNQVRKTKSFDMIVKKRRDGNYLVCKNDFVYVCMTSDFFIEEADEWRKEVWKMIKKRSDLNFYIITKRIERFYVSLPDDWNEGYFNVTICVTCENQKQADRRLPILLDLPIQHKEIICEPMLEEIRLGKYLQTGNIKQVTCGGESGNQARICNYDWIISMKEQCQKFHVSFYFKQTGAKFMKNHKLYLVSRPNQMKQARKANINFQF